MWSTVWQVELLGRQKVTDTYGVLMLLVTELPLLTTPLSTVMAAVLVGLVVPPPEKLLPPPPPQALAAIQMATIISAVPARVTRFIAELPDQYRRATIAA